MFILRRNDLTDRNFLCGVPFFDSVASASGDVELVDGWTPMHSMMIASISGGPKNNGFRWLFEIESAGLIPVHDITPPEGFEKSLIQSLRKRLMSGSL